MTTKQRVAVLIGLIVSAVFLWIAFSNLNPADVLDNLSRVNVGVLVIGWVIYYVAMLAITWRWQFLLRAIQYIPLASLYQLVAIGYMGNNVYPFRSGEVLRIALLNRSHKVPVARATTTVFVERIFDGIVMLTFIILPLMFIENADPQIRAVGSFAAMVFIPALAVFLLLATFPNLLRRFVSMVVRILPGKLGEIAGHLSEELINGLAGLRSPRDLAGTVFASYLSWSIEACVYYLVALAFGLEVTYPMMLTVVGVVNIAGLIPSAPGQIGVFEWAASSVLVGFGVANQEEAVAYALLNHIAIWLPPTLLGFIILARRGLSFSAVTHAHDLGEDGKLPAV